MRLTMAVDYCDLIWKSDALFDEEAINRLLGEYAARGVNAVQWRVSVFGKLLYNSKLGDKFTAEPFGADDVPGYADSIRPTFAKCNTIMAKMDPMEVAVRLCRKHGIAIYPWLTIYDDAGFHHFTWSRLIRQHPEFCWKSFDGEACYHGVTSYVYPQVVGYRLAQIEELLGYEGDGIYLCTRSHSRPPGYTEGYMDFLRTHKPEDWKHTPAARRLEAWSNECRGRFGFDPPAVDAYRDKTGREPAPDDAEWWAFRYGYLHEFLKKAKALARRHNGDLCFGPHADSAGVYPRNFFDWKKMLDEKVVDEVHIGATDAYCGIDQARIEYPELFESPGRKSYFCSISRNAGAEDFIRSFEASGNAQFLDRFDGITAFEAYHFLLRPGLWSFIDHMRRTGSSAG
jgi:hypothetical protein